MERLTTLTLGVPDFFLADFLDEDPLLASFYGTISMVHTPHACPFSYRRRIATPFHNTPMYGTVFGPLDPDIDPLKTAPLGMTLMILTKPRCCPILHLMPPFGTPNLHTRVLVAKCLTAPLPPLLVTIPHGTVVHATEQGRLSSGLARVTPSGTTLPCAGAVEIAKGGLFFFFRGGESIAGRGGTGVYVAERGGIFDLAGAVASGLEAAVLGAAGNPFTGSGRGTGWVCAAV